MLSRLAFATLLSSALVSCWRYDPLFCDEQSDCWDNPNRTFCDVDGIYAASEGIARTCIPTPEQAQPDAQLPDLQVATAVPRVYLQVGKTVSIDVRIQRGIGAEGAVSITVPSPPEGITFDPLAIASDAVTGTLVAHAADPIEFTERTFTIRAEAGQSSGKTDMIIDVVGVPGTLDTSFGEGGSLLRPELQWTPPRLAGAFAQGDRVVFVMNGSVARIDATGEADPSFGSQGQTRIDVSGIGLGDPWTLHIAEDAQGRILVAGSANKIEGMGYGFFAARLTADGSFDLAPIRFDEQAGVDAVCGLMPAPDGKFLIATTPGVWLHRFFADGRRDAEFVARASMSSSIARCAEFLPQEDGTFLVNDSGHLRRLDSLGRPDPSFGDNGAVTLPDHDLLTWRVIRNGTPNSYWLAGEKNQAMALWQIDRRGQPNAAFGGGGLVGFPHTRNTSEFVVDLWTDDNGDVYGAGILWDHRNDKYQASLFHTSREGRPDETFGSGGRVVDGEHWYVSDAISLPHRRVLFIGNGRNGFLMKRFWY